MQKIIVLNPKGGCGKTTIATNLASYFANQGLRTSLMDYDPQGSSMRWIGKRGLDMPPINGIRAFERNAGVTRSWQLRVSTDTQRLIVDTPASLDPQRLTEITRGAHAVIVPVLPSDIDIHAASRCIADLLLVAKLDRRAERIAVVANRVRRNTNMYQTLTRFLDNLSIPFIATLRDTQRYVQASTEGLSIYEIKPAHQTRDDRTEWDKIIHWLESRPERGFESLGGNSAVPVETKIAPGGSY
ncbi:MAG TPA: AAA family ATPase [Gammaproteobacteria bacterium]|nr:AAA family ATPase [Gammaproteobacteria bacterium]